MRSQLTGVGKKYTGTNEDFKKRHYTHDGDTKTSSRRSVTALGGGFIWEMKHQAEVKWEFLKLCNLYKPCSRACDVCLQEKLIIMKDRDPRYLNKRSELMITCRHKCKFKLDHHKD